MPSVASTAFFLLHNVLTSGLIWASPHQHKRLAGVKGLATCMPFVGIMGGVIGKSEYSDLAETKLDQMIVEAMIRRASEGSNMRSFDSIVLKFPKIDESLRKWSNWCKIVGRCSNFEKPCWRCIALVVQNISTIIAGLLIAFIANWELALIILGLIPMIGLQSFFQVKLLDGFNADAKKMYEEASQVFLEVARGYLANCFSSFKNGQPMENFVNEIIVPFSEDVAAFQTKKRFLVRRVFLPLLDDLGNKALYILADLVTRKSLLEKDKY
ncbi:ABC transporter B family member 9 [Nymphaea thermarum]|nr:ABC transporter B family member 9 [Nymphaea thermarum]